MRCFSLVTLVTIVCGTPHGEAAAPFRSPSAGSDVVLTMRPGFAGELRLRYRKDVAGKPTETVSVGISDSYHYVDSSEGLILRDYKLRRILQVRHQDLFVNDSVYAEVWFRAVELRNRLGLARAVAKAGITPPKSATDTSDSFWIESDLGALSPEAPLPELKEVIDGSRVRWLLKQVEVAAVRYENQSVPGPIRNGLRRFWATFTPLHPQIADALASSSHMPAELWIEQKPFGQDPLVVHWTLVSSHWVPDARYPLAPGLAAHPTIDTGAFPDIFTTLSATIAEKRAPPAQDVYISRADDAIRRGAGLEAVTWLLEMNLAQGRPRGPCQSEDATAYCSLLRRADALAKADSRTAIAFMKQAPNESDRARFDSLPNAYLLRLLWATRPPGSEVRRSETEHDLLAALQASPIANFCKDAGDFYAASWQPFAAWQIWDLGRMMAGHAPGDLLDSIDTLEANLTAGERIFF